MISWRGVWMGGGVRHTDSRSWNGNGKGWGGAVLCCTCSAEVWPANSFVKKEAQRG